MRSGFAAIEHAVVGLRFEDQKTGQRGEKLERIEGFQLLQRRDAIRNVEHAALLLVVGEVFFGPSIQVVAGNKVAAFELRKVGHGGKQIVIAHNEDFVGWAFGGIYGREQDARRIVALSGFPSAQIFKMEEGFELVMKGGDFRGSYARRERQNQLMALNLGRGKSGVARGLELQGPEQTAEIGKGRDGQQRGSEAQNVSDEPSEECFGGHCSRLLSP